MTYYRVVLKRLDSEVLISDITKHSMPQEEFEKLIWTKPVIYHFVNEMHHFLSLEKDYLTSMIDGIKMYEAIKRS